VWEWYGWRRALVSRCRPNAAHLALARAARAKAGIHLVTQNVDGLHVDAARALAAGGEQPLRGAPLELHGSLFRARCTRCGDEREHREPIDATSIDTLPACARCGALLRPAVVWFGEPLDEAVLERAWSLAAESAACLVVGTSAVVQPAASLAEVTRRAGGAVIEVNPEPTPLTPHATVSIRGTAVEMVPRLLGELPVG